MLDWVRRLPGRRWDADRSCWVATSLGAEPDQVLAAAEFTVDMGKAPAQGITTLGQMYDPIVELRPRGPRAVR